MSNIQPLPMPLALVIAQSRSVIIIENPQQKPQQDCKMTLFIEAQQVAITHLKSYYSSHNFDFKTKK